MGKGLQGWIIIQVAGLGVYGQYVVWTFTRRTQEGSSQQREQVTYRRRAEGHKGGNGEAMDQEQCRERSRMTQPPPPPPKPQGSTQLQEAAQGSNEELKGKKKKGEN